jgi:predicted nuclease of predicted toxin-antitoxin system
MQFIIDESTGSAVVDYLRDNGHDVLAVNEDLPQADDFIILDRAVKDNRILITNDKDFGFKPLSNSPLTAFGLRK